MLQINQNSSTKANNVFYELLSGKLLQNLPLKSSLNSFRGPGSFDPFKSIFVLIQIQSASIVVSVPKHVCSECGLVFVNQKGLEKHIMESEHKQDKRLCEICGVDFDTNTR